MLILTQALRHSGTQAPRHPGTQAPGHPGTRALCHLLTGSHGVGLNRTQGLNVSVIDESLTIQGSYSIDLLTF